MAAFLHVLIFFPNNAIFIARKYTFIMKKIRLTESDLHNIIESAVRFIIQEKKDNAAIIKWIAEKLKKMEVNAEDGENTVEVQLSDNDEYLAFIEFDVVDNRYLIPGEMSHDYDVPDDPDDVGGDFEVIINSIKVYDNEDNETSVEDDGTIAKILKNVIVMDESNLKTYEEIYGNPFDDM